MEILAQNEDAIYDLDKMMVVYATTEGQVQAMHVNCEQAFLLGQYKNYERAKEVILEIFALSGAQSKYDMPIV